MNKKTKKHSSFIVITFCILFSVVFKSNAQDYSGRISEIKKMYAEIGQLEKSEHPLCKTGVDTTYESFDNESEKYPFIQRVQYCNYSGNYQTASGYFTGYEWTRNMFVYLKNKAVFFIFIEGADAGCIVEYRIYYDINGNVIKVLKKENDCDGDDPYKSSVIQSLPLINSIVEMIKKDNNSILKLVASNLTSSDKYKGFIQDASGFYYKYHINNNTAAQPQEGDMVVINFNICTTDSIINKGVTHLPLNESFKYFKGDLYTALKAMHLGDSVTFIFPADSFAKYYLNNTFPFDNKEVYMDVRLLEIMTKAEIAAKQAEYNQKMEIAKNSEESLRNDYLKANNIQIQPTATGLYYIQTNAGTGKNAEPGKLVTVHYTGKLLDGTVFDSSIGKNPITIQLGAGQVIPGWEEGIAMMKEGGKATLIIPSKLAYDSYDAGMIPPYSTLVFDVELISVTDAPQSQPTNTTPQQSATQRGVTTPKK